jgi:serine/threonine-protein kinase
MHLRRQHGDGFGADVTQAEIDLAARLASALGQAFRLDRELGGGGMSRVFVAEEAAFGRSVVVKVLRPELAESINAKRFQREIHVAARLQHPHIVPLLSAGEGNGLLYYTMPFVEGESLRAKLRREGELSIADTIRIIRDVAGALAYAHKHGVIHRDIKPENVLLSDGGAVVADFGIAKALSASRASADGTTTTTVTEQGTALGTPLYMAPEQAAGDAACDHRVDLYALGTVAYEMLTGRPPFEGRPAAQLLAAHATEEPDPVAKRRPNVPAQLAALIMACLEKHPADRPPDANQVVRALDDATLLVAPTPSGALASATGRSALFGGSGHLPWWIAGTCAVLGGAAVIALWERSSAESKLSVFPLALPDSIAPRSEAGPSIGLSPDGSLIVYIGSQLQSLFVRALNDPSPRRLSGTEGAQCPSFAPDGQWIVFVANGRLKKVALAGGLPVTISDSATMCGVWIDQREILFDWHGQLFRVSADGGAMSLVAKPDTSNRVVALIPCQVLPGKKSALVLMQEWREGRHVGVLSLSDGHVTKIASNRGWPHYSAGYLLMRRQQDYVGVRFSPRTNRLTGPEVRVPLHGAATGDYGTSASGSMVYLTGGRSSLSLVAVDRNGRTRKLGGKESMIPLDTAYFGFPRISPDGRRVALEMLTGPSVYDIWVYDIPSGALSRLTSNFTGIRPAGWTADGRSIVYFALDSSRFGGPKRIVSQPWDGSGSPQTLLPLPLNAKYIAGGPQKGYAVFSQIHMHGPGDGDIWVARLATPGAPPRRVARGWEPWLSADGELVAYTSNETGRNEAYVQALRAQGGRVQVSSGGGWQPLWDRERQHLYYRAPGYLMRATITREPELRVSRRDTLFRDVFFQHDVQSYDVFPGGKELLMILETPAPFQASVVLNWTQLLAQRTPR